MKSSTEREVAEGDERSGPLVLIVDDHDDHREVLTEFLHVSGFRIARAVTSKDALEQAFAFAPDLILLDLALPEFDGIHVTRRLKSDQRTKQIPIVALTTHGVGEHASDAHHSSCEAFLTRPCLPDVLVGEIRRVLDAIRAARESS